MEACLRCLFGPILIALSFSMVGYADQVNSEWYSPLRTLSMGNVAVALSDDADASMFFNPAGLARIRKVSFEFLNPRFEVGTNDFSLVHSHLAKMGANTGLQQIQPYLAQRPKWASSLGLALYPNFQAQNFAFGILMSGHGDSYMDTSATLHAHSKYLVVPTMGFSASLIGGRFRIGAAVHAVQMTSKTVSTKSFTSLAYSQNGEAGFGFGLDAGAQMVLPLAALPTFGVVARNLGATTFTGSVFPLFKSNGKNPGIIRSTYDLGFSIQPKVARSNVLTISTDYRDVQNQSKTATLRKINLGTEFGLSRIVFVRAGIRSGYWTAGFGLQGKSASLDIGSYADELDDAGFRKIEDRRVAIQFGNRF